jgi:hypothetical protein
MYIDRVSAQYFGHAIIEMKNLETEVNLYLHGHCLQIVWPFLKYFGI